MDLYHLIYRSKATIASSESALRDIFITAKRNNSLVGITGCFIYRNGYFLQFLEGKEEVVKQLFYTIEDDNRHEDVEILIEGQSEIQLFRDYESQFLGDDLTTNTSPIRKRDIDNLLLTKGEHSPAYQVFWQNVQQINSRSGFYAIDNLKADQ